MTEGEPFPPTCPAQLGPDTAFVAPARNSQKIPKRQVFRVMNVPHPTVLI